MGQDKSTMQMKPMRRKRSIIQSVSVIKKITKKQIENEERNKDTLFLECANSEMFWSFISEIVSIAKKIATFFVNVTYLLLQILK